MSYNGVSIILIDQDGRCHLMFHHLPKMHNMLLFDFARTQIILYSLKTKLNFSQPP